jgi:hypothetical protein
MFLLVVQTHHRDEAEHDRRQRRHWRRWQAACLDAVVRSVQPGFLAPRSRANHPVEISGKGYGNLESPPPHSMTISSAPDTALMP